MGGQVVADNVWLGGVLVEKGTRRQDVPEGLAGAISSHLWVEEGDRPNISASGDALTGLSDNVWVDGVMYQKGSVPPEVAWGKIGSHLWVGGSAPDGLDPAREAAPDAEPATPVPALEPALETEEPEAPAVPEESIPADPAENPSPEGLTEPAAEPATGPEPLPVPNRGGKGSSRTHWADYATSRRVEVSDDMERNEIIAACTAAGVPVD